MYSEDRDQDRPQADYGDLGQAPANPAPAPVDHGDRYDNRERERSPREYQQEPPRRPQEAPRRPPGAPVPTPSNVLGVFGLSIRTRERDLEDEFSRSGRVEKVVIVYDQRSERSRGFGFVTMADISDAERAIADLNGVDLHGRRLRVDFSATVRPHDPTPGAYKGIKRDDDFGPRGGDRWASSSRRDDYGGRSGGGYGGDRGGYGGGGYGGGYGGGGGGGGGYGRDDRSGWSGRDDRSRRDDRYSEDRYRERSPRRERRRDSRSPSPRRDRRPSPRRDDYAAAPADVPPPREERW